MTTTIIKVAAHAPAGSFGKGQIDRLQGFPERDLVSLMRFAGTFANEADGASGAPSGTYAFLEGGGVNFSDIANVRAPAITVTDPWTIIAGVYVKAPVAAGPSGRRSIIRLATDYGLRGLQVFIEQTNGLPITAEALHGAYLPVSLDGAVISSFPSVPYDQWVARFETPQTMVIRHHGGGQISLQQRVGKSVAQLSTQININSLRGGPGDLQPSQAPIFGMMSQFASGELIYDAAAVYSQCLNEYDLAVWTAAHEQLANSRGRS
jgi:hypothetical protein